MNEPRLEPMLVGINYPWIDYGWDFGDPPQLWVPDSQQPSWREKKRIRIEEDFGTFASQGISAVRWFVLADGLNYGVDEFAPHKDGKGWTFDPLPVSHPFYRHLLDDFEFVLQVCRKDNLKLFPSLIDFHWCQQGMPVAGSSGIVKCGRYEIVRDPSKRQAFFDRTLEPLLDISVRYQNSIFAWELINEPEWAVRRFSFFAPRNENRNISRREMKRFIAEGVRRINAKQLLSSVGFAHWKTLDRWDAKKLGLTLNQFHYYAQNDCSLPERSAPAAQPCVVGEFATNAEMQWPELKAGGENQTIADRLRCIEQKGYSGCFMWSARAADTATSWTDAEHRELIAFTRPPGSEFRA